MKKILNWQAREVVDIYDDVSLWSAPFGRILLENIPMKQGATIVDLGFGTGFPLIELSQRFGKKSKIHGIDIWHEAINKVKEKLAILEIDNIEIHEKSATSIQLVDNSVDLVTSNLGVNNFEESEKVYSEINRVLKSKGSLCITTNPIGTFEELFDLMKKVMLELDMMDAKEALKNHVDHRKTQEIIAAEIECFGLKLVKTKTDSSNIRFVDAEALMDYALIRIGFREYWDKMIGAQRKDVFYENLYERINHIIKVKGEFVITIPILYLEFKKP